MKAPLNIDKMIVIDNTGMPKAPGVRQLQDKDVLALYARDTSPDKQQYIKEAGVIYWLGDPKSPAMQQGLSPKEALKSAIENYGLPKSYQPDALVMRIRDKYYHSNITEAGVALEALRKSIHLSSLAAVKINELLNKKLNEGITEEAITSTLALIGEVKNIVNGIPNLTKSLVVAYENLQSEEEQQFARGGMAVLSSMDADESNV